MCTSGFHLNLILEVSIPRWTPKWGRTLGTFVSLPSVTTLISFSSSVLIYFVN